MDIRTYITESLLNESGDHEVPLKIGKELEKLKFTRLADGAYMINPTKKYTDVITVQKDGNGILVMWSVGGKHDNKEITNDETIPFVTSLIGKFEQRKQAQK